MEYHKPTLWDTNLAFYEKPGFFYYKKLKQHVFIDGQLINKKTTIRKIASDYEESTKEE